MDSVTFEVGIRRQREAMDLVTFGVGIGRQREAMDLVIFEVGITTGTRLGGNGRQLGAIDLITFGVGIGRQREPAYGPTLGPPGGHHREPHVDPLPKPKIGSKAIPGRVSTDSIPLPCNFTWLTSQVRLHC